MGDWDFGDLCWVVAVVCFICFVLSPDTSEKEKTARIVSCNQLKAQAIAASAPEPHCAF